MTSATLADRLESSLRRQIAAFTTMVEALADIERRLQDADLDALAQRQRQHEKQTQELAREYHALLRESEKTHGLSPADRDRLRPLAQQVEALTKQLQTRYEEAYALAQQAMHTQQDESSALRRGKDMLSKYRPAGDSASDYFDRSV